MCADDNREAAAAARPRHKISIKLKPFAIKDATPACAESVENGKALTYRSSWHIVRHLENSEDRLRDYVTVISLVRPFNIRHA